MTHALARDGADRLGSRRHEPAHAPPAVTRERARDARRSSIPGRVILGIGRGDNAVRTLGLKPVPTAELAEIVPQLRALMAGRGGR